MNSTRSDRAWAVYELAVKALTRAEQQERWKRNPYGHPDTNRRLREAVERAQRAVDVAAEDLTRATRFDA